jgi:hypothetical protein
LGVVNTAQGLGIGDEDMRMKMYAKKEKIVLE